MSDFLLDDKMQKLNGYIRLIESFVGDRIDASTFEVQYLQMFKNDVTLWQWEEYETLSGLFSDIDTFCADASIRDDDDLDEPELRAQASAALQTLKSLVTV